MTEQRVKEIRASYEEQTVKELFLSILTNIEIECGGVFSRISICSEDIDNYITLGGIIKNRGGKSMKYLIFTFEQELLIYPMNIFSLLESTVKPSVTMIIREMILLKNELCVTAKREGVQWIIHLISTNITCSNWNEFMITCFEIGLVPVIVVYENSKLFKGTNECYERTMSVTECVRKDIHDLCSKIGNTSESLRMPFNENVAAHASHRKSSSLSRATQPLSQGLPPLSNSPSSRRKTSVGHFSLEALKLPDLDPPPVSPILSFADMPELPMNTVSSHLPGLPEPFEILKYPERHLPEEELEYKNPFTVIFQDPTMSLGKNPPLSCQESVRCHNCQMASREACSHCRTEPFTLLDSWVCPKCTSSSPGSCEFCSSLADN